MLNPKELALNAVLRSLENNGLETTQELSGLIEDLINKQWEERNQDNTSVKDEAKFLKLIRDYVSRNMANGEDQ